MTARSSAGAASSGAGGKEPAAVRGWSEFANRAIKCPRHLTFARLCDTIEKQRAAVAELADARDLKSLAGNSVRVRSPLAALSQKGTRERLFLRSFLLFMSAKLSAKNA